MMETRKKGSIARDETFDEFLSQQGLLPETEEMAIKELIAEQIRAAMEKQGITKTAMAVRMHTSRRQLERLLNPENPSVTLSTLRRAATAVGAGNRRRGRRCPCARDIPDGDRPGNGAIGSHVRRRSRRRLVV